LRVYAFNPIFFEVKGSHVIYKSQPEPVGKTIIEALVSAIAVSKKIRYFSNNAQGIGLRVAFKPGPIPFFVTMLSEIDNKGLLFIPDISDFIISEHSRKPF